MQEVSAPYKTGRGVKAKRRDQDIFAEPVSAPYKTGRGVKE